LKSLKDGKPITKVAEEFGRSVRAVSQISSNNKKLLKDPEDLTINELFDDDGLEDFSSSEAVQKSLKRSIRLLEQSLNDAENSYVIVDERMRKVPIKTLMDCIEKAVKAHSMLEAKNKNTRIGDFAIDYVQMASLYKNAKKNKEHYDSEQHMKDLLNLAHGKIKDGND
jgi:hypothetical protein